MMAGHTRDFTEALAWYRKAAEQGHADAQSNLGWMYVYGHGVAQDRRQAHTWVQLAVSRASGDARANCARGRDISAGRVTPEQVAEARMHAQEWADTFEQRQSK